MDEKMIPEIKQNEEVEGQVVQSTPEQADQTESKPVDQTVSEQNIASVATEEVAPTQTEETPVQSPQPLSWQQDSGTSAPAEQGNDVVAAPPRAKLPAVLIAVIAVLVVGILAVFAGLLLIQSPEKAVRSAQDKSKIAAAKYTDQLIAELPAMAQMAEYGKPKREKTNFNLTLEGISGAEDNLSLAMVSNMLKGFGVSGTTAIDSDQKLAEASFQVGLGDMSLIDGYFHYTPDEVAFGIPKFSETIFSIVPATLKEDFLASEMYKQQAAMFEAVSPEYKVEWETQMTEQLETLQKALVENAALFSNTLDVKQMQDEMLKRVEMAYEGATYEKMPKENGQKVYKVTYQGATVKKAVLELVRYIYLDSSLTDSYNSVFTAEMLGGMSYKEMIEQQLVKPLEENLPEIPVVVIYKIGKNKVIQAAEVQVDTQTFNAASKNIQLEKAIINYTFDEKIGATLAVDMLAMDVVTSQTIAVKMDSKSMYENKIYNEDVNFVMDMDGSQMLMNIGLMMDAVGKCDTNVDMSIHMNSEIPEYSSMIKIEMAAGGGVKVDGDKHTWEYPAIDLKISEGTTDQDLEKLGGITLGWKSETTPLEAGYTASKTVMPFFKMTTDQLAKEMEKYSTAIQALSSQISSMAMGGAAAPSGTPESGANATPEMSEAEAYFNSLTEEEMNALLNMSEEEINQLLLENGIDSAA